MKISVNYATGNWFMDGVPEIGTVREYQVGSLEELDYVLDLIPDEEWNNVLFAVEGEEDFVLLDQLVAMMK